VSSNALGFGGAQNEAVVPDAPTLSPSNALTISAWVKAATNLTSEVVAKWSTNTNAGSYLLSLTNGRPMLELMLGGSYTSVVGQASCLSSTNWHHLAGTYDGAKLKVYVDATLAGSAGATGTVDVVSDPLRIGLLAGQLDDARLYDTALTATNLFALWYADSDGDGWPDFMEADGGTNPNDLNSFPSGGSTGAVYRATCSVQTAPAGACSQTKTYNNHISLGEAGVGAGGTIHGYLESDEFGFEPTPGHFEVMINSARFDDKGSIAGIDSYGPSASCGWPNELANELVDSNQVTIVGKRLRVNVSATDNADCAIEIGWYNVSITWKAWVTNTITLVDAQGFQPQLNSGVATLQTPITNTVASSFNRVGALTDGASLIVVQLSSNPCSYANWTVGITDTTPGSTNGAAQLGSLHHGSSSSLPQLPATLGNPGNTNLTLGADETAIFYRPPPSWAFGKETKEHNIQLELKDPNGNSVTTQTLTLRKPPLVLVHGWIGAPGNWNGFVTLLTASNIVVDTRRADYEADNTSGLDTVFVAVPQAISNEVAKLRTDDKLAATRLDVVAHSYGGIATRWYMTPGGQLPDGQSRTNGANPMPLFRTTTIKGTRSESLRFLRADNFGIGDIRRFITLGTPHAGTSAAQRGIQIINRWVEGKAYRNREMRNDTMLLERVLRFQAIGLNENGTQTTEAGMSVLDAAAFGIHPTTGVCGACPPISLALSSLAPIPVKYLPIEGTWYSGGLKDDLLQVLLNFFIDWPADIQPGVSDRFIPALSARNRTERRPQYNMQGVGHSELTSAPALATILEQALGADDAVFIQP